MKPDRSSDGLRAEVQPVSAPTWADDVTTPAAPTDAPTFFGHAISAAPGLDPPPSAPSGETSEPLANLGALIIDQIDLGADIIRLITVLTTPESPPAPEPRD